MARKTSGFHRGHAGEGLGGPKPSKGARRAQLHPCPNLCHENDASKGSGDVLIPHTDSQLCATATASSLPREKTRRDTGIQKGHRDPEWMGCSSSWLSDLCIFTVRNEETGLASPCLQGITDSSTKLTGMTNSNRKDKKKD